MFGSRVSDSRSFRQAQENSLRKIKIAGEILQARPALSGVDLDQQAVAAQCHHCLERT
jgi:hypothetical protein